MALTINVTTLVHNADDTWTLNLADGQGFEFGNLDSIKQQINELQGDPRTVALVLLADWLGAEPLGDRISTFVNGKSCTFDLFNVDSGKIWIR